MNLSPLFFINTGALSICQYRPEILQVAGRLKHRSLDPGINAGNASPIQLWLTSRFILFDFFSKPTIYHKIISKQVDAITYSFSLKNVKLIEKAYVPLIFSQWDVSF